ncbi:MAG: hypothetical protein IIY06_10390 [Proteobacteria bacterium]|jgi:hypothetical protein|nr:hypothetical protein [Pseudomonadota bacterium]
MRPIFLLFVFSLLSVTFYSCSYDIDKVNDLDGDGYLDQDDGCPDDPYKSDLTSDCPCNKHLVYYNDITGQIYTFNEWQTAKGDQGVQFQCLSHQRGDTDSDGDGIPDEDENFGGCPRNALKFKPGVCGCDKPESENCDVDYDTMLDSDGDTVPDVSDGCPKNPCKQASGGCGCDKPDERLCAVDYTEQMFASCLSPT